MGLNEDLNERVYDKTYNCPFCKKKFKSSEIKKGKTTFIEMDLGLRQKFEPLQPDYYYAIVCQNCGYAGVTKTFSKLNGIHIKNIQKNITPNYVPKKYPLVYDAMTAIDRYKLALYFSHIKEGNVSEKAYIAQKLGTIYEDIGKEKEAQEYNLHAFNWYNEAYINEEFPILDMEEPQLLYNIAYLAYKLDKKEEAKKTIGKLVVRKDLSSILKEKVEDFSELLKHEQ